MNEGLHSRITAEIFWGFFTLIYLAYYAYLETHSHLQLPNTQIIKILKEYIYRLILNTMLLLLCNFQDLRNGLKISLLPMESVSLLLTSYRAKHHMTRGWSRSPWSTTRPPASIFSTTGTLSKWPSRTTPTAQVSVKTTRTNKFTTVQVLIEISRRNTFSYIHITHSNREAIRFLDPGLRTIKIRLLRMIYTMQSSAQLPQTQALD